MPFPWVYPKRVKRPQNRAAMYRREIEERAALLHRLNYSRETARARLLANVSWDFEVGAGTKPLTASELDRIIDEAWTRGGSAAGGPPLV